MPPICLAVGTPQASSCLTLRYQCGILAVCTARMRLQTPECADGCRPGLQVYGPQMIAATGAAVELRPMAEAYLRVRSFAQPALLVSVVTQSVLLAERDSLSPSLAVLFQVRRRPAS